MYIQSKEVSELLSFLNDFLFVILPAPKGVNVALSGTLRVQNTNFGLKHI